MFKQIIKFSTIFLMAITCSAAFTAVPVGCLIEPERVAEVGSQVIGIADKVLVERGDSVRQGQVLATLRSDIERASVDLAKTRSQLVAEVKTAEENLNLAKITEKRSVLLVEKKFISEQALDKAHAETEIAKHRLTFAKEQLRVSNDDLGIAKAQLNMRAIRAPFDGIIAERYIWPGERVEEKPLFKIVKINPLRVELVAPVEMFGTIHKNDFINITPDLPDAQLLEAKVTLVDRLVDGASNTFRIRAEIPNPSFAIPSGLRCKAAFAAVSDQVGLDQRLNKNRPFETVKYQPTTAINNTNTANTRLMLSTKLSITSKLGSTNQLGQPAVVSLQKPNLQKSMSTIAKKPADTRAYY